MKYRQLKEPSIGLQIPSSPSYFFCSEAHESGSYTLRNTYDYAISHQISVDKKYIPYFNNGNISLIDNSLFFYEMKKSGYYKYSIDTQSIEFFQSNILPVYKWSDSSIIFFDREHNSYIINEKNIEKRSFQLSGFFHQSGILQLHTFKKEEPNWIRCLNPIDNEEKWRIDYPWHISRNKIYKQIMVIEYNEYVNFRTLEGYEHERNWYNPNKYTIAINLENGEEIWRKPYHYKRIDMVNGLVLAGKNNRYIEIDIETGNVNVDIEISPPNNQDPNYFDFILTDDEGIYFLTQLGYTSFGKIERKTGKVIWEFDLIIKDDEPRKITGLSLLGNGKLALRGTGFKRGQKDIACIFSPTENMEFSNVKDGVRLKSFN